MPDSLTDRRRKLIRGLRRARVPASFLFVLVSLSVAQPTISSVLAGVSVAAVGVIIRAWASGYLRKDRVLIQAGPYALTRNPLYLGSFLMGIGLCLACGRPSLLLWFALFFGVFYYPAMVAEREHLRALFGPAYDRYEQAVPLFLPRVSRGVRASLQTGASASVGVPGEASVGVDLQPRFAFSVYRENREYRALLGFVLVCVLLLVKAL
jgi:protein-S-isoprenylcysteine O-methyltransferase Ste14